MKRAVSLVLAFILAIGLSPAALAASAAYGSDVWLKDTVLQDGVVLSDNTFWSGGYDRPRHEYYITYSPGASGGSPSVSGLPSWLLDPSMSADQSAATVSSGSVRPVAAFGSSVCDRLTAKAAAEYYEQQGYRVVGTINGDFYDTSSGYPLGMLISNGQLLSGSGNYYAVGFRADGSVVMGEPKLMVTARTDTQSMNLAAVNKPRVEGGGITLMTYYYRNDHSVPASSTGITALCTVVEGRPAIGGQMTLQVEEVSEDAASRTLQENQVILTVSASGYADGVEFLRGLVPGQALTLSFVTQDPAWNEVTEAIGALYLLVKDGKAQSGFEATAAPRTAVGVKANGDLVLYTIDGRQNTHSMGASLGVLAQRMEELGCVTALCLDGGGSTTAAAALPDSTSAKVLNSPSDKSLRKVSNHIVLLAPGQATGQPGSIYLTAGAPAVMVGHTVELSATLADTNYFPLSGNVELTASAGQIAGSVLTAPMVSGPVTVTAYSGGLSAQREVLVVDGPDEITLQRSGSDIDGLNIAPGQSVQLTVAAKYNHLPLEVSNSEFSWRMEESLGTVDENGLLTAALTQGSGYLTVSRGGASVTIPIYIKADVPFVDMEGHWASTYMSGLYHQGILTGTTVDGKLYAYPDKGVTRAEFSVLLCRYLGINASDYAGVVTPFTDLDPVDAWAGDYIRAMYSLGIVNGITQQDGTVIFDPQGTLTRSQAVTMLGRMLALNGGGEEPDQPDRPGVPDGGEMFIGLEPIDGVTYPEGYDPSQPAEPVEPAQPEPAAPLADLSQFTDADQILPYAVEHFQTMVGLGVIGGTDGRLDPDGIMTRAAVCKVLATLQEL
jgi:hypothetical protein